MDMIRRMGAFSDRPEELVPHEHCQLLDTTIAVISTQTNLGCLEDLMISVPCTYDIYTIMKYDNNCAFSLCRIPLARGMSCLRSLSLKLCDNTGPQGQRYYHKQTSMLLQTFGSQEQYAQS